MTSDLTTKAAEIRAGLVAELRDLTLQSARHRSDDDIDDALDRAAALIEQQAAELAERDERVKQLIAMCKAAELKGEPDRSTARERMRAAETRATTAESERDELLREKERLAKLSDRYGVALMMIRAGCSQPQRFAGNILDDKEPVEIDLEDCDEDHR